MSKQLRCLKHWKIVLCHHYYGIATLCGALRVKEAWRLLIFHYLYWFCLPSTCLQMDGVIIAIVMIKCWSHNVLNRIEYGSFTLAFTTKYQPTVCEHKWILLEMAGLVRADDCLWTRIAYGWLHDWVLQYKLARHKILRQTISIKEHIRYGDRVCFLSSRSSSLDWRSKW